MNPQSEPLGQHSKVVLLARAKQAVDAPQQNPFGKPLHCVEAELEQVEALLNRSGAGEESAVIESENTATKAKYLDNRDSPMVRLCASVYRMYANADLRLR